MSKRFHWSLAAAVLVLGTACQVRTETDDPPPAAQPATTPPPATTAPPAEPAMRLEVVVSERQLHVYRAGNRVATHGVAVGQPDYPTPRGNWAVSEVIWNPEWIPPDSEWAREAERAAPGEPGNPLGRIQMVYNRPYSIHGTNRPATIGQAASHGSIRVTNEVGTALARDLMEAGGAPRDDAFFRRVRANRNEQVVVNLPNPIPIEVR
jgi:lipoprotein-anchoring transpeptidase ErfK/SrfK